MPCKKHFGFLATVILAALMVTLAVALPGVSADGGEDENRRPSRRRSGDQAPPIPDKTELNYPNLGSHLDELVTRVEDGQATSQGRRRGHSGAFRASVAVTIYLTDNVDDVVTFLEENGGDPRNVGEDYIEAYVPVTAAGAGLGAARRPPGAGDRAPEWPRLPRELPDRAPQRTFRRLGTRPGTAARASRWE